MDELGLISIPSTASERTVHDWYNWGRNCRKVYGDHINQVEQTLDRERFYNVIDPDNVHEFWTGYHNNSANS